MPDIQFLTGTRVTGEVMRIRFQNPDTGFVVAEILCDDETRLTLCGVIPGCAEGQCVEADGKFEKHENFGLRFKVEEARIVPPSTIAGIERFLRYQITGIGPKRKQDLIKKFQSITAIKNATLEELLRVLPVSAANEVFRHFHHREGE